jgi:hypothetical protein
MPTSSEWSLPFTFSGQNFVSIFIIIMHVMWACHNGRARHQVADGGDGLQIWMVAANILNKQLRTAGKGWSSILGLGEGLTPPHHKKKTA